MKDDQVREAARANFGWGRFTTVPDHAQVSQTANGDYIVEAYVTVGRRFVEFVANMPCSAHGEGEP